MVVIAMATAVSAAHADLAATVARVKASVVIVGTFKKTGSPPFELRGTGFVVGNGNLVATNAHVIIASQAGPDSAALAVVAGSANGEGQLRAASLVGTDPAHDLALLRIEGGALPGLDVRNSDSVREGQSVAFMGFPIGGVLGFSPVTHRGIISAITTIAPPGANARRLDGRTIRSIKGGAFQIFQLDATAYPGNSGGPLFDPDTGEVLGIINMVFVKGTKESVLSQPSGISYAIPSRFLQDFLGSHQ